MQPQDVLVATATAAVAALATIFVRRPQKAELDNDTAASSEEQRQVGKDESTAAVPILATSNSCLSVGQPSPILQLYSDLCQAFGEEKKRGYKIDNNQPKESFKRLDATVRRLIKAYVESGATDWQRYENWSSSHYVRNLVEENEDFEMMVLCWKHGQGSRVHNHASSHGWVTVLSGQVIEDRYAPVDLEGSRHPSQPPALPGVLGASSPCPALTTLGSGTAHKGTTAYINDREALHAVRCDAACPGQGAVTLHIYAPPVRRVRLYEPDNNRVVERKPGFYSVRGVRT